MLARFEREAKAVAALSHPNILAIHDYGNQEGVAYAVMELLEGETLRDRSRPRSDSLRSRSPISALQVARGLSAAHAKGIVHRDLKPENLFLSKDGHVKILDFGLAKRTEKSRIGEETSAPTQSKGTEPGTVMGTVGYMSPEQVRGREVDHRSDIFSFGTILYEMLSGNRAFKRDTASDTMAAIMRDEPPELAEPGTNVPQALEERRPALPGEKARRPIPDCPGPGLQPGAGELRRDREPAGGRPGFGEELDAFAKGHAHRRLGARRRSGRVARVVSRAGAPAPAPAPLPSDRSPCSLSTTIRAIRARTTSPKG